MQVSQTNSRTSSFFQAQKKQEENGRGFQAQLRKLSEERRQGDFSDEELKLSKILKDFQNYAINKAIKDKQKHNENTLLNKLFALLEPASRFKRF